MRIERKRLRGERKCGRGIGYLAPLSLLLLATLCLSLSPSLRFLLFFPFCNRPVKAPTLPSSRTFFTNTLQAYHLWDHSVTCQSFIQELLSPQEERNTATTTRTTTTVAADRNTSISSPPSTNPSLQNPHSVACADLRQRFIAIRVKKWKWLPDDMDNLYSCDCGLSCLWTKSGVLADKPDAELYETSTPPFMRHDGDPLRVYMDLEPGRHSSLFQDLFVSYHAHDSVQATYAGAFFHKQRNYYVSPVKNQGILVYWSSSRCILERMSFASKLLALLPHHSFGRCLNNVGGQDKILSMYPECKKRGSGKGKEDWSSHLHCAMSHYKFVLAIENTITESYVTEKLFYALDSGAVPIYLGAPNVWDFIPPQSIIDASKFSSPQTLAAYVKKVAVDPILYAQFHAWRRCGVMGNYQQARALSLDSLPCRLCAIVSKLGGRNASIS